jgi:hypothetical protein
LRRSLAICAVLTSFAFLAHIVSASWLAPRDPIALATSGHAVMTVIAVVSLSCARAFLLLVPGWWIWLVVRVVRKT